MTVSHLKKMLKSKGYKDKDLKLKKDGLIEKLLSPMAPPPTAAPAAQPTAMPSHEKSPLLAVLEASFMKPLTKQAKEYARIGLDNEKKFIQQMLTHSDAKLMDAKITGSYECGLVSCTGQEYVKDSCDAIGIYDNGRSLLLIEIKSRMMPRTFRTARNILQCNLGYAAFSSREVKYVHISTNDFSKWVPDDGETFQLLHHIFTYNTKCGMILVSNSKRIMYGVIVDYDVELLAAYDRVLTYIQSTTLKWAYGSLSGVDDMKEDIVNVLGQLKLRNKPDWQSFYSHYYLCRAVSVKEGVQDHSIPTFHME